MTLLRVCNTVILLVLPPGAIWANRQHPSEEEGGGGGKGDPKSVQERPRTEWRGQKGQSGACQWCLRLVPPGRWIHLSTTNYWYHQDSESDSWGFQMQTAHLSHALSLMEQGERCLLSRFDIFHRELQKECSPPQPNIITNPYSYEHVQILVY